MYVHHLSQILNKQYQRVKGYKTLYDIYRKTCADVLGDAGPTGTLPAKQKHKIAGVYTGIFHVDVGPLWKLIGLNILSTT